MPINKSSQNGTGYNQKEAWGKEKCKKTYVESIEALSCKDIAEMSGRHLSTVYRWSTDHNWVRDREEFQSKLKTVTQEKTIKKVSEEISQEAAELAKSHLKSYQNFRDLVDIYASVRKADIVEASSKPNPEKAVKEAIKAINPTELNFWNLVLDRCIKGEAYAANLKYHYEPDRAIKFIEAQSGNVVVDRETWDGILELLEENNIK